MQKIFRVVFFLIILNSFSFLQPLEAQEYYNWYQGGLKVKVVSSRMTIDSELVDLSQADSEVGYQFGFFARLNIDNIYVQPELLFSKTQTNLVFNDFDDIAGFDPRADFEFNTLEIPLEIGYRVGNFRLNTGPNLSLLISGQRSFLNDVEKITNEYNRTNVFWNFGIGGDFNKILFDVKYEFGLSKTGESLSNIVGTEFVPRQRQWVIAVGFNFLDDY